MTETKTKKAVKAKKTKKVVPQPEAAPPVVAIPEAPDRLPRGQERLADGTIRLKTGSHDLGSNESTYEVNGVRIPLSGRVLIACKDVNWLAMNQCGKCGTKRIDPVNIRVMEDGHLIFSFICHNNKNCSIGGEMYVQVHSPGKFVLCS